MLGILAYGSLLTDPGCEIEAATDRRIESMLTPFEVEYARSSSGRSGAPTLVPVENGKGTPVQAQIFILQPGIGKQEAKNMLYRREIDRVCDQDIVYDEKAQLQKENPVLIKCLSDFPGVPLVLYASLKANIDSVLDNDLSAEQKARELAELAIGSVGQKTFAECRDGIRYLDDAICHGVRTPLTEPYKRAVLQMADDAPDLETARLRITQSKHLTPQEAE